MFSLWLKTRSCFWHQPVPLQRPKWALFIPFDERRTRPVCQSLCLINVFRRKHKYGQIFISLTWLCGWMCLSDNACRIYSRTFSSISCISYPCLYSRGRPFCFVNVDEVWLNTLHAEKTTSDSQRYLLDVYLLQCDLIISLSHYLCILVSFGLLRCAKWVLLTAASVLEERQRERTHR